MKKHLLSLIAGCAILFSASAQRSLPYTEDMSRGIDLGSGFYSWSYACGGIGTFKDANNNTVNELTVSATAAGASPSLYTMVMDSIGGSGQYSECYGFLIVTADASAKSFVDFTNTATPYVHITLKSDVAFTMVVALNDGTLSTDGAQFSADVLGDNQFHTINIPITSFTTWDSKTVDKANITAIQLIPNKNIDPAVTGTIVIDKIQLNGSATITGVMNSISNTENLTISPNPTNSYAKVSFKGNASSDVVFNVSNSMGVVVKSVKATNTEANVNVEGLAKGIYFVTAVVDGTSVSVNKLVVE